MYCSEGFAFNFFFFFWLVLFSKSLTQIELEKVILFLFNICCMQTLVIFCCVFGIRSLIRKSMGRKALFGCHIWNILNVIFKILVCNGMKNFFFNPSTYCLCAFPPLSGLKHTVSLLSVPWIMVLRWYY
jgi:hypothetical protein